MGCSLVKARVAALGVLTGEALSRHFHHRDDTAGGIAERDLSIQNWTSFRRMMRLAPCSEKTTPWTV